MGIALDLGKSDQERYRLSSPPAMVLFLALLVLAASAAAAPAVAQDAQQAFIAQLGAALGVPAERLTPDTDLVDDLLLDRLQVYEALGSLCESLGLQAPPAETTRISDILDWLEEAPPLVRQRGRDAEAGAVMQRVFFATNRRETGATGPTGYFGGGRSRQTKATLGYAYVSIPPGHKTGALESPLLQTSTTLDARMYFAVQHLEVQDEHAFYGNLSRLLQQQHMQDGIVVFVHGYNVTFDEAVKRTAQLAYDSGFAGVPIAFSWPSEGRMLAYNADREDVTWSIHYIERFLAELRQRMPGKKIHLIAHSMGSQGLIGALFRMALRKQQETLFDTVVLAAPDFDADYFRGQIAGDVRHLASTWVVYASDKDSALDFSTTLNAIKRLGQPVTPLADMQVVDATGVEVTPWNVPEFHSYYATKKRVIDDIMAALRGASPADRRLQRIAIEPFAYWRLAEQ